VDLDRVNALTAADLTACCAAPAWVHRVLAGRPYPAEPAFRSTVDAAFAALSWVDIEAALAGHPRLGERAPGAGQAATWSRSEQSGVTADTAAALAAGNAAYEQRFGHVYLARAAGRSGAELLALLQQRLGNDTDTERAVVRAELRDITWLRLDRLVAL
jgi:2-oxo-4-hydroxy-4-carboxy-5-ureidoimidazoline decarboxylase